MVVVVVVAGAESLPLDGVDDDVVSCSLLAVAVVVVLSSTLGATVSTTVAFVTLSAAMVAS